MSDPDFPTLHTPRLVLREILLADAPALLAVHGNAQDMRWFGSDPLADLAAAEGLVAVFAGWRRQPAPGTRWGLSRRGEEHRLLGSCGLFGWNRQWRKCTLGYELHPSARGQGLMDEALRTVLDWGFAHMRLNRIEALVHPDNAASRRSLQRLGFQAEGLMREAGHWHGRHHDLIGMALLARDWRAAGAAQASA
ncbi:GNAT family N-acetyltransferase [Ideonella sp. 4Y11]|uniref:GNAT family N-acetyltransferase n=1 Tax=Ideonella aquatica TaxID=2824119 RepID=A0A940YE09_9BURK|nr:GNAT family protein [Ideonella aquatica]MBQ0958473.1 GNAT family N-acetyltransferase [Ideonella aquatica]